MPKYIWFLFLINLKKILTAPSCKDSEKFCSYCNILTNLCLKCENDVLISDDQGGCKGAKICQIGKNYCEECDTDNEVCKKCSKYYYPDENGGCSFTDNCQISYRGNCLKCKEDFILIGLYDFPKICKSLDSEDFNNCKKINNRNGFCEECVEKYFLNSGDKKCIETENCKESVYGKCISCNRGYYLDNKDKNKCKPNNETFIHCSETEDGKKCSKCENDYYFDDEGKCVTTNYCSQSDNFNCIKCKKDYFLTEKGRQCTKSENCYYADKDSGACLECQDKYYLDVNDERKCKSNQEDDDLKFCTIFKEKCEKCKDLYYLGDDSKCSSTSHCLNSEFGICKKCIDKYYLGKDNKCTSVEHCIYSNYYYSCLECEDGYYYDSYLVKCIKAKDEFENCKKANQLGEKCSECKDDFYIIKGSEDGHCYPNDKEGPLYKCSLANQNATECEKCRKDFYLGEKDKRCTKFEGCAVSEEGDERCLECEEDYCLDLKKGSCEYNYWIYEEKNKIYYMCNRTNEEGTKCGECVNGYILGDDGYCKDYLDCEEEDDNGECLKCKKGDGYPYSFCVNKDYACVDIFDNVNCLRCDNSTDFDICTECKEGYELVPSTKSKDYIDCMPIEKS